MAAEARQLQREPTAEELRILRRGAVAARKLARLRQQYPLAFAVLWEPECPACPDPAKPRGRWHRGVTLEHLDGRRHRCPSCGEVSQRTSQRAAAVAILAGATSEAFLLGGNRSGKTEVGAMICAAFILGRDHPDVRRWLQINRLDGSRIQPGPGRVWMVAQTFGAALEYQRPTIQKYLPPDTAYKAWGANLEGQATTANGGVLVSKAIEQAKAGRGGKNPFEGARLHFAWFDEDPHILIAVESTSMRLVDLAGPMLFTMTPLRGWTPTLADRLAWMREGKERPAGLVVQHLHGVDNPHIDRRELESRVARLSEAKRKARLYGEIVAVEGLVYEVWDRSIHVVPAFDPPADWPRYQAIDFGTRNPFCAIWAAIDPQDHVVHIYRCHYQAGWTTREHARHIWAVESCPACWRPSEFGDPGWWDHYGHVEGDSGGWVKCKVCGGTGRQEPEPGMRWADPAAKAEIMTMIRDYDLSLSKARKSVSDGIDAVMDLLTPDEEGRPHLLVHDCCQPVISEFEGYIWDPTSSKTGDKDAPLKKDDHAMDAVRYLAMGLRMIYG